MHGKTATKLFRADNRPITEKDTGVKFFKGAVIALGISAVFWCVVFYGIYEATK